MPLPQRVRIAEQLIRRIEWDDLDRNAIRRLVECARDEVLLGHGLVSRHSDGGLPESRSSGKSRNQRTVELIAGADLVACGNSLVPIILSAFGCKGGARSRASDGSRIKRGSVFTELSGDPTSLEPAIETILGFLRRLSGIATRTCRHVEALGRGRTRLLDTGPSTPGLKALEKYACACGGAWSSGASWGDRVRISAETSEPAGLVAETRGYRNTSPELPVEITVRSQSELEAAVDAAPDVIRLDRFTLPQIRRATAFVNGRAFVEAHGGVSLGRVGRHRGLGLDFLAVDDLTSGASWAPIEGVWRK